MSYEASCHCGALTATIAGDIPGEAMSCNCSICRRKGHLLTFVPKDSAQTRAESDNLSDYMFNKHNIHHRFCATCGCAPYGSGTDGDGNEMVSVNLRCVPECDLDTLTINRVDGASF